MNKHREHASHTNLHMLSAARRAQAEREAETDFSCTTENGFGLVANAINICEQTLAKNEAYSEVGKRKKEAAIHKFVHPQLAGVTHLNRPTSAASNLRTEKRPIYYQTLFVSFGTSTKRSPTKP